MSQIVPTKKADTITLPRSATTLVGPVGAAPTVINLAAIGHQRPNSSEGETGQFLGLSEAYGTIYADGADLGLLVGAALFDVTGAVAGVAVTAGGSGYTSAPAVTFSPTTLVQTFAVTAGGSGYTSAPTVTITSGGGTGASAVAVIDTASGTLTGVTIAQMGTGYTSAPTVAFSGGGTVAGGAAATAILSAATGVAAISGGVVTGIKVTNQGAGYGSAGGAVVSFSGGGGSGAAATATIVLGAPVLAANGCGAGDGPSAPGVCARIPNAAVADFFARPGKDVWLGVVGSGAGTIRIHRSSY
jgi:hypothetical protein